MFGWLHDVNTKSPLPSRLKLVIAIIVGGLLLLQLLHYVLATPEPSTPEPPMPDDQYIKTDDLRSILSFSKGELKIFASNNDTYYSIGYGPGIHRWHHRRP
jgi:hypothetical protein